VGGDCGRETLVLTTNKGIFMSLSTRALLVTLSISGWTGRKLDRKATGNVEETFLTEKKIGNFHKRLLPGALELEKVGTVANSMRRWLAEQTLPWLSDGTRMLSSKNYYDFMNEFRQRNAAYSDAVDAFLLKYPDLRVQAKIKLGELFNDAEYPTEDKLRTKFKCSLSLMPMPEVTDFRTEILDSEKEKFIQDLRNVETRALRECYSRLKEVVSRAAERLSQPDSQVKNGLLESITEICELLPKLNITDDAQLESIRKEVETIVSGINPETVRANKYEKDSAAKKLAEIDSKMSVFMGKE
jgi:hypothetical protein